MLYPAELRYSKSHEWVKTEDGVTVVGISDFAQNALGDVVFVNLPAEGDSVAAGEAFGDVESVKAVSDLVSPVTGTLQSSVSRPVPRSTVTVSHRLMRCITDITA